MRRARSYVLSGDPILLPKPTYGGSKLWTQNRELKFRCTHTLQEQHGESLLFNGALSLDITFYFPLPSNAGPKAKQNMVGKPHLSHPDIPDLLSFIQNIMTGVIIENQGSIVLLNCTKTYCTQPRTEFTISEIKKGKG